MYFLNIRLHFSSSRRNSLETLLWNQDYIFLRFVIYYFLFMCCSIIQGLYLKSFIFASYVCSVFKRISKWYGSVKNNCLTWTGFLTLCGWQIQIIPTDFHPLWPAKICEFRSRSACKIIIKTVHIGLQTLNN